jgi:hypothetical protein
MNNLQQIEQEQSVLRWGGLAGVLGSIIFILVFIIVIAFVGSEITELNGWIVRFPEIRAVRTVENSLYLVTLMLWVIHFLSLYRALRGVRLAPALFGSVVGISGLVVLMAGALPHIATTPLSDLYHAPGATPEDQVTLVLIWQATQGIFDTLLITGLVLLPISMIALGVAMLKTPTFGKGFSGVSVILGVAGAIAAFILLIDPHSPIAVVGVFALILFHLVLGWKVYRLSRTA